MFETKPRRIASSAISRWLQWLIGRSLSDGFSQVIAITAQICSGVYVAGAPERGASASRSGTDWAGGACRHRPRPRQYRTVFGHTSSSRALSRTPTSSAACNIMRIRNANCCDVEWARSSASSASRCAGSTITGSAANRGIATSRLSFRLVMPHRRRFDSALCRKAASFRLPSYLHASRSRDFRSAVLVVAPAGAGKFAGRLDGRDLCVSTKPLLDAARVLLAEGVDPEMVMQMHHLRSATLSLRSTVGAAAGLTVLEGAPFRRGHRREVRRFLIVTTRASRVAVDRRRRTVRVRQGWACVGFDTLPEADYTDDSACTKPQQSQHGSNPYSRRGCCPVVRKHVVVPSQSGRTLCGHSLCGRSKNRRASQG